MEQEVKDVINMLDGYNGYEFQGTDINSNDGELFYLFRNGEKDIKVEFINHNDGL